MSTVHLRFKPNNKIPYMQDMQFFCGVPSDITFDAKKAPSAIEGVELRAPGYGKHDGSGYGSGAIFVCWKYIRRQYKRAERGLEDSDMNEHSVEPWRFGRVQIDNLTDGDGLTVAKIFGKKGIQLESNKALLLAAPKMKRELEDTLDWARTHGGILSLERRTAIGDILATTEPAKPPTLLDACKMVIKHGESSTRFSWSRIEELLKVLRDAVAAEEARNADPKTT